MVFNVKDKTGRFGERPHFEKGELDRECEKILFDFLRKKYGKVDFPVSTEDLMIMIERDVETLDVYSDLSEHGEDVEGLTEFLPGKKPIVQIASKLSTDERYENRFRTTLTHEYGHVRFHRYLVETSMNQQKLFESPHPGRLISKRDNIMGAQQYDWMEWQAGYACGAFLMPITPLKKLVGEFTSSKNHFGPVTPDAEIGIELRGLVAKTFKVSDDAARIRLLKLDFLGQDRGPSLF